MSAEPRVIDGVGQTLLSVFAVPGASERLWFERATSGKLLRLWCDGRVYFADDGNGEQTYGDGLARVRELRLGRTLTRHVRAAGTSWLEEYRFDEVGRPVHIDGVDIVRDEKHRVIACKGGGADFRYGYTGDSLAVIDSPHATRWLTAGPDGRPAAVRDSRSVRIEYDSDGTRFDVPPLPETHHRDPLGRLWTITGADGLPRTTYLWDGLSCIGRIDGPVGAPLAACFSLDPTFTPVRIITAGGVTRVPRDAFGESLLAHEGVPGLQGGAIHGGFVHFHARAADVRIGAFDRRDPLHGRDDDPRRADGYAGALLVETPACGPYAIAQYDPVGRIDPKGELSVPLLLSTLSWSWQHNVGGWLGLDFTIGLITDFVISIGQLISLIGGGNPGEAYLSRFFDAEPLYNRRTGIWGVRRGFFGNPRAFTYQHIVVSDHESFEALDVINVLVPPSAFTPVMDGTILRVDFDRTTGGPVNDALPILLRGNRDGQLTDWTRSGGARAAVAPGSPTVWFPEGGIHLPGGTTTTQVPQAPTCTIRELVPIAAPILAALAGVSLQMFFPPGLPAAVGDQVLLTDGAGALDIKTVSRVTPIGAQTLVTFTESGLTTLLTPLTVQGVTLASTENLNVAGAPAPANRLSVAGTAGAYAAGDPLLLLTGATRVATVLVASLEAQIVVDGPLPAAPAPFGALTSIEPVPMPAAFPNAATLDPATSSLTTGTLPVPPGFIALTGNGVTLAAATSAGPAGTVVLDRLQAELTPLGPNITWQNLPGNGTSIGTNAAATPGPTITYTPATADTLPAALTTCVILRDGVTSTARVVVTAVYDAIVITPALPAGATFSVQRFTFRTAPFAGQTLLQNNDYTLPAAAAIPAGSTLQFTDLGALALAAGGTLINGVAAAAGSVTLTAVGGANLAAGAFTQTVTPGQVVVLTDGPNFEANVVRRIRATITLDRAITAPVAGSEFSLVALNVTGIQYAATVLDAQTVVVFPFVGPAAVPPALNTNVQMPRFDIGNLVLVTIGATATACRVTNVDGTTLTLADLPAPFVPAQTGTVQLLVPVAAGTGLNGAGNANGTWRIGHTGVVGLILVPPAITFTFEIWDINHVRAPVAATATAPAVPGTTIAIVQPGAPTPTTAVANVQTVTYQVDLLTPPTAALTPPAGGLIVTGAPAPAFYASLFNQTGTTLTPLATTPATVNVTSSALIVPYGAPPAAPLVMANVPTSAGTVRIPDDAEEYEISRRESLVFHELTHTRHSAEWGPWFLGFFPLFLIEMSAEFDANAGLPAWSAYVPAVVRKIDDRWFLVIESPGNVAFAAGDILQVEGTGIATTSLRLLGKDDRGFFIAPEAALADGAALQVRRPQSSDDARRTRIVHDIGKVLTVGGLTNYVFGFTWGHVIRWIFDLWYVVKSRVFNCGTSYPARIESASKLEMTTDEGRRAIQGFKRVYVESGGGSTLVDVSAISEGVVTVKQTLTATGDVKIRPYDHGDRIDGLDYWDARVPDPLRPARIVMTPRADGKTLSLDLFDRVSVAAGNKSTRTNVTVVGADGSYELEDKPPTFGLDRSLRIAYVDENDPVSRFDSEFLAEMGMGWLRWVTDPYGQLHFGIDYRPKGPLGTVWEVVARVLRYGFSSRSFTGFLLIPGYLFLDDLFDNWGGRGHETTMEQEASQESGNLYSPLGKIRMGFSGSFATRTAFVGDLAHYWYTPNWGAGQWTVSVNNFQDTPGVNVFPEPRVVPTASPDPGRIAAPTINAGVAPTDAVTPGRFVPDVFFTKGATVPHAITTPGDLPPGLVPNAVGRIPLRPELELSNGMYVAFNQAGTHRVTVRDTIVDNTLGGALRLQARQAFESGDQTIFFDVTVSDVTVTAASVAIAAPPAAGALPAITVIPTQVARVTVVADAAPRTWALTVTNQTIPTVPATPAAITVAGLTLVASATLGTEIVELSRRYDVAGGAYVDAVLAEYGTNLPVPRPIDISVRLFQVTVVNTISMAATRTPGAPHVPNWLPNSTGNTGGFVLVPASLVSSLSFQPLTAASYPPLNPVIARHPSPIVTNEGAPANLTDFLGPGGVVFRVDFFANEPPEQVATIPFSVTVGTLASPSVLTLSITLSPNFTLNGPVVLSITGNPTGITLTSSDGTVIVNPTLTFGAGPLLFVTTGPLLTITAPATAALGLHQILVADAANPQRMAARTINVVA